MGTASARTIYEGSIQNKWLSDSGRHWNVYSLPHDMGARGPFCSVVICLVAWLLRIVVHRRKHPIEPKRIVTLHLTAIVLLSAALFTSIFSCSGEFLLIKAMDAHHTTITNLLLALHFDTAPRDPVGHPALIRAAIRRNESGVQILNGRTTLFFAYIVEIVEMLAAAGADLDVQDQHGSTALMENADTPVPEFDNQPAMHCALVLIAHGANVNLKDHTGRTALMFPASRSQDSIIRALIEHGADRTITDNEGKTALAWAQDSRHEETIKLIKLLTKAAS